MTLLLMLLAFGALIAAGIPVLLAGTSVAATIGLLAALSHLIPADSTVSSMIVLIGMAVGVDYSLFYLKREREERAKGRTTLDAVEIAARTSGHSILVSGGAVIASMAGLFVVGNATFNSLAIGAILVVAVAVLGSITVLPALLVKLGRWVDRPRVPLLWRLNRRQIGPRRHQQPAARARWCATPSSRSLLSGVVVLGLAIPALGMKTHSRHPRHAARLDPAGADGQGHQQELPGRRGRLGDASSCTSDGASPRGGRGGAATSSTDEAVATGDFVASGRGVQTSADGTTSVIVARHAVRRDRPAGRRRAARAARRPGPGRARRRSDAEHAVGGGAAESLDFAEQQHGRLALVIGFVLLLTMLIMVADVPQHPARDRLDGAQPGSRSARRSA